MGGRRCSDSRSHPGSGSGNVRERVGTRTRNEESHRLTFPFRSLGVGTGTRTRAAENRSRAREIMSKPQANRCPANEKEKPPPRSGALWHCSGGFAPAFTDRRSPTDPGVEPPVASAPARPRRCGSQAKRARASVAARMGDRGNAPRSRRHTPTVFASRLWRARYGGQITQARPATAATVRASWPTPDTPEPTWTSIRTNARGAKHGAPPESLPRLAG